MMLCPKCMEELEISERQGIEIDYCKKCRGVWLDRGELDKIIDRTMGSMSQGRSAPAPEPSYRRDRYDDDYHYKKKKRKRGSFLEDIFDFD